MAARTYQRSKELKLVSSSIVSAWCMRLRLGFSGMLSRVGGKDKVGVVLWDFQVRDALLPFPTRPTPPDTVVPLFPGYGVQGQDTPVARCNTDQARFLRLPPRDPRIQVEDSRSWYHEFVAIGIQVRFSKKNDQR